MPAMPFDRLQPELWTRIIESLAKPTPKPLSGLTKLQAVGEVADVIDRLPDPGVSGTMTRKDIRQGDLASLMRTSIELNNLATPILYRTVTTDDLMTLTDDVEAPRAHPRIQSKAHLLAHTRTLHLEYRQKGNESTYTQILNEPRNWLVTGERTPMDRALIQGAIEADDLGWRLLHLSISAERTKTSLPNLRTLTVGAIFGGQDGLWEKVAERKVESDGYDSDHEEEREVGDTISTCQRSMVGIFRHSPIAHFCQRGHAGPLSLPHTFIWADDLGFRPNPSDPEFTEFNAKRTHIPAAIGHRTRWILEQKDHNGIIQDICGDVVKAIRAAEEAQSEMMLSPLNYLGLKHLDKRLLIDIYGSGNLICPPGPFGLVRGVRTPLDAKTERKFIDDMMTASVENRHRLSPQRKANRVSWRAVIDSPACEACGAGTYQAHRILRDVIAQAGTAGTKKGRGKKSRRK